MSEQLLGLAVVAVAAGALAALMLAAMLAGPDWVSATALGLLFSNVAVLSGLSGAGLVPYLLLLLPPAYQVFVRADRVVWGWPTTAMLIFGAVAVTSTVFSPTPERSLGTVLEWTVEGAVFLVAVTNSLRSPTVVRRSVMAVVLAGGLIALLVYRQHSTGNFANTYFGLAQVSEPYDLTGASASPLDEGTITGDYRSAGMVGEVNFFAMAMASLVPWAIYLVVTTRSWWLRIGWLVAGVAIAEAVVLSYSRGAQVALVASAILLAVLGFVPRRVLLALPVIAVAFVASNPTAAGRFLGLFGLAQGAEASSDASARGRFSEVLAALRVFTEYPLFGVGPGQFPDYFQRYAGVVGGGVHVGAGGRNAHNLVAGLAADIGLVGLASFAFLIGVVLVGLLRARRTPELSALATAALASLTVYLAASFFLHLAYARYLWLLVALAASVIAIDQRLRAGRPALAPRSARARQALPNPTAGLSG